MADIEELIEPEPAGIGTLCLGLDGTGTPVRKEETESQAGKQADGSGRT